MRVPDRSDGGEKKAGMLRLRHTMRGANRMASLRMTTGGGRGTPGVTGLLPSEENPHFWQNRPEVGHPDLHRVLHPVLRDAYSAPSLFTSACRSIIGFIAVAAVVAFTGVASAATYYVSSSTGSDSNSGTSSSSAWQTIGHVNAQTFSPGDSILLKRGDVWNESLAPPSSGSSGNPITFDAYGTGAAPNLTGYYAVPRSAWQPVTTNAWKATLPTGYTAINFCLFGSIWGQKVPASTANLTANWDFYLSAGFVYVYTGGGNPADYYGDLPIVPMAVSNVPLININSQSWLTFQHILVNWFDQYGVYVQGTSDHLVFANMEADSMIPQGTQPLGFYVSESSPGPGDVKIYNSEVRSNDYGWGQANDRNLLGRFTTQTFSLPRVARTQNYFLRLYNNASPPQYSRYSAALHVDYPL